MQVILNKQEKEKLVIKLHQEGKTIRQIAKEVHASFTDIGKIIRKINGNDNDEIASNDVRGKSKATQALNLFLRGKRPVKVAIELDLSASEIEEMQQEFWVLTNLDELALVYLEIKSYLDLFLRLFHIMKNDLPSLENKFRDLANIVLDLEIRKKELSAQLIDLGYAINQYQCAIDSKKEQLMKMDVFESQKAIHRGESKLAKA